MEVFKSALALATFAIYNCFLYNFKIVQAYFLILDNIVGIDSKYLLLKELVMLDQQL
jgi:hypothetical protein